MSVLYSGWLYTWQIFRYLQISWSSCNRRMINEWNHPTLVNLCYFRFQYKIRLKPLIKGYMYEPTHSCIWQGFQWKLATAGAPTAVSRRVTFYFTISQQILEKCNRYDCNSRFKSITGAVFFTLAINLIKPLVQVNKYQDLWKVKGMKQNFSLMKLVRS